MYGSAAQVVNALCRVAWTAMAKPTTATNFICRTYDGSLASYCLLVYVFKYEYLRVFTSIYESIIS